MAFPSVPEEIMNNPYLGAVAAGVAQGAPNPWRRQDFVAYASVDKAGDLNFPAQTAKVVPALVTQITGQPPATGSVTVNLATDAIKIRPDNGIWDDTGQVWISCDLLPQSLATPRSF